MNEFNVQMADDGAVGWESVPMSDRQEIATHLFSMLQTQPVTGAAYPVIPSRIEDGVYNVIVGSTIVSYTVDAADRKVKIIRFSGVEG